MLHSPATRPPDLIFPELAMIFVAVSVPIVAAKTVALYQPLVAVLHNCFCPPEKVPFVSCSTAVLVVAIVASVLDPPAAAVQT